MRTLAPLLLVAFLLAACGGSGNSGSSDPGSKNYDPAQTTLKKAGLESCSEATRDLPAGLTTLPGLGSAKAIYVAKACNGATKTPNAVYVFQFTSVDTANQGVVKVKAALPTAATLSHYPLVIATTGPNKDANLAAIKAQLPPETVVTTTS